MKKKICFIISNFHEIWPIKGSSIFIAEPYVDLWLSDEAIRTEYKICGVAPHRRKTKQQLISDSDIVDQKYNKYMDILIKRLNTLHNQQYSRQFWKKTLSLAFVRHITLFYDVFMKCQLYFDEDQHYSNIISDVSFYTPIDYEDHRNFFHYTNLGHEQLLSTYLRMFFNLNEHYYESDLCSTSTNSDNDTKKTKLVKPVKECDENNSTDQINVGLLGVLFNLQDYNSLIANKKIGGIDNYAIEIDQDFFDMKSREYLSHSEDDFDKFDLFFFETLKHCMPRHLVEDFKQHEKKCLDVIDEYHSLRYVISECWISDSKMSLMLALMKNHGIQHIHNEHNCFFHPCEGKYFEYLYDLADSILTLGWDDNELPKLIKAGSLFPFTGKRVQPRKHDILYVSAPAVAHMPHYSSSYAVGSENAPRSIDFAKTFFNTLSTSIINRITYRPYPTSITPQSMAYDKEAQLKNELSRLKTTSNHGHCAKLDMCSSNIVVIDYISTAYLEALISDIPTIFFWNPNTYYLKEKYKDFFLPLTAVGICQSDPSDAAKFLDEVSWSPEEWWLDKSVRNARKEFLELNIGEKHLLLDFILDLTNRD